MSNIIKQHSTDIHLSEGEIFASQLLDTLEKLGIKEAIPKDVMEQIRRAMMRPVSFEDDNNGY